ncbi:MAG: restriction endonuclease subunit S [Prevotella sp.]|nr:restriction endonuclease subunit S [Prevotella sp.]
MKEGWENNSLGKVCRIFNGNSINADYKKTHYIGLREGYPFIATKDVSFDGLIDYENGVKIPFDEGLKVAKASSVFICVEGGSAGRKIGLIDRDVCFGNKLFCLETKGSVLGSFIYYYLKSGLFQEQFAERLTGLIGGVSAKKFNDISIIYPPLSEQQSIVDYLDSSFAKIDAMKANAEKALNEAKALFQASLKEMLEPKEGWEEKTLREIVHPDCTLSYGIVQPGEHVEDGVPVVRPVDFNDKVIVKVEGLKRTKREISETYKRTILKGGEILLCVRGTTGTMGLASDELTGCNVTRGIVPIFFDKDVDKMFVYYQLLSPKLQIEIQKKTMGAALKQINIKDLRILNLMFPPLSEQQSIVTTLDSLKSKVDRLQANYEKISQECDALKQAILRQVFE